jgi:hypothetical protein
MIKWRVNQVVMLPGGECGTVMWQSGYRVAVMTYTGVHYSHPNNVMKCPRRKK